MDNWICDNVEKICHKLQRNFGISIKLIKYITIFIYAIAAFIVGANMIITEGLNFSTAINSILILILPLVLLAWSDKIDETYKPESETCNPNRIDRFSKTIRTFLYVLTLFYVYRVIYDCITTVIEPTTLARLIDQTSYTLFWVLMACTPLPPQKSRLKKWVENFFTARQTQPVTANN